MANPQSETQQTNGARFLAFNPPPYYENPTLQASIAALAALTQPAYTSTLPTFATTNAHLRLLTHQFPSPRFQIPYSSIIEYRSSFEAFQVIVVSTSTLSSPRIWPFVCFNAKVTDYADVERKFAAGLENMTAFVAQDERVFPRTPKLWGMLAVGKFVRFYKWNEEVREFAGWSLQGMQQGGMLELDRDGVVVQRVLDRIKVELVSL